MASGSFTEYIRADKEYIKVTWSSTPIEGKNQSKVTVSAKMYRPYAITSTSSKDIELSIGGNKFTATRSGWGGNGWTNDFIKKEATITHDEDGSKSIKITLKVDLGLTLSGKSYDDITLSQTVKLDKLTTKSTITTNYTSLKMGNTITVNLNRASSTVRHRIFATIEGSTQTFDILKKANDNGSTKSYTYTFNANTLLPYIKNASSKVTITCRTFKNASSSTKIGDSTKVITLNLTSAEGPRLTADDVALTYEPIEPNTITDGYVVDHTKLNIVLSPTLGTGDAGQIASCLVTYSALGSNLTKTFKNINAITLTELGANVSQIRINVTDKRGLTSATVVKEITNYGDSAPVISGINVMRCTSNGTLDGSGTYAKVTINATLNPCHEQVPLSLQMYYRRVGSDAWVELGSAKTLTQSGTQSFVVGNNNVLTAYSYEFKAEISSSLMATPREYFADIGTEEVLIDVAPNGVGVGKVVEHEYAFECGWNAYFTEDIYINGQSLKQLLNIK